MITTLMTAALAVLLWLIAVIVAVYLIGIALALVFAIRDNYKEKSDKKYEAMKAKTTYWIEK